MFVLSGFGLLFLQILFASWLLLWGLQGVALLLGAQGDWPAIFLHLIMSLTFLVLFPGQTFWTLQCEDRQGRVHTIVGSDEPADMY
jgi:ABC-type uncharacterized transport system YnjBCD permease subunit